MDLRVAQHLPVCVEIGLEVLHDVVHGHGCPRIVRFYLARCAAEGHHPDLMAGPGGCAAMVEQPTRDVSGLLGGAAPEPRERDL